MLTGVHFSASKYACLYERTAYNNERLPFYLHGSNSNITFSGQYFFPGLRTTAEIMTRAIFLTNEIIEEKKFTNPVKKIGVRPFFRLFTYRYMIIYAEKIDL